MKESLRFESLGAEDGEEKFIDTNGEFAQGEHIGDPVDGSKPTIAHSGEGTVHPLTIELMNLWRQTDTGQFSGDRHHGQPGDPGYVG